MDDVRAMLASLARVLSAMTATADTNVQTRFAIGTDRLGVQGGLIMADT